MADENEADLRRLNEEFPLKENAGDRMFFETRLASVFAFRRASGALDSREMFLLSLAPVLDEKKKRACDPKTIEVAPLPGASRFLVHCVVTIGADSFHNTRLFVKDAVGRWQLLAWANERSVISGSGKT